MSSYYIASIKHTLRNSHHITFWASAHCGYALALPRFGTYCYGEAIDLNNGLDTLAIPTKAVEELLSPEPYFRAHNGKPARWYDTRGPVVDNTRSNWDALIAASLTEGRKVAKPKVEVFRGKRRCSTLIELTKS